MKKTKSIFALLITLSLILGTVVVPVQAADKIVIKAQDYSQDIVPAGAFAVSERAFTVGSDCEVTYDIIAPQAGNYHVTANMCTPFEEPVSARTGVGDKLHYTVIQTKSTTFQDFYVGTFKLEKGKNYLSFGSELGESFLIKFFELEFDGGRAAADFQKKDGPYKNHYLPGRIQAEDFDIGEDGHGSEEGHTFKEPYRGATKIAVEPVGTKYMITLHDKEWAKYTFNVTQSGSYDVGLEVGYGDAMEIYFDGSDGCFSATTERHGGSTTFGTVYLEKGVHTMKLHAPIEATKIDYIYFTHSSKKGILPKDLPAPLDYAEKDVVNEVYKNLYISADATPGGDGSFEKPFATFEEAQEEVRKLRDGMTGDIVVNVMSGEYVLDEAVNFGVEDGGKDGHRVIYRGMNTLNPPVISGGKRVTGWKDLGEGLWAVDLPDVEDMRQLYVGGYHAQRARARYVYYPLREYDNPETPYPVDGFYISTVNFPKIKINPGDVEIVDNIVWTNQRIPLKDIREAEEGGMYILEYDQPYYYYYNNSGWSHSNAQWHRVVYFENAFEFIDEYGEFYFDKTTRRLYYYPYPEEDMNTIDTVIGSLADGMFKVMGNSKDDTVKYITFDNLEFRYGTWLSLNETGCLVYQADCLFPTDHAESGVAGVGPNMPGQLEFDCAEDMSVKNCRFRNLGSPAIDMLDYVYNSEVVGNLFIDNSSTAVMVGRWSPSTLPDADISDVRAKNILIKNNVIKRVGVEYYGSVAIGVYYARNVKILNNDIEDTPYTAITLGWGWGSGPAPRTLDAENHTVKYNSIVDISKVVKDGGHVYTLGDLRSTVIERNYMEKSRDAGGIYYDQGSCYIDAKENVYIDCLYWFNSNSLQNHDNTNTKSYSDCFIECPTSQHGKDYVIELPEETAAGKFEGEALEIVENAGVEPAYKRLLKDWEYPEWRTYMPDVVPRKVYVGQLVQAVEVQNVKEGGEGVGFHTNYTKKNGNPNFGYHGAQPILGDTMPGEWCAYDVEIYESGTYDFEFTYSQMFNGEYNDTGLPSRVAIYVDGEKKFVSEELVATGHWWNFIPITLTTLELTKGVHEIKFEFVDRSVAVNKFTLIKHGIGQGNEPAFNDGGKFTKR